MVLDEASNSFRVSELDEKERQTQLYMMPLNAFSLHNAWETVFAYALQFSPNRGNLPRSSPDRETTTGTIRRKSSKTIRIALRRILGTSVPLGWLALHECGISGVARPGQV